MSGFFTLGTHRIGVRGVKLPYTGLDLQGDTPQDVALEPDMLHALSMLYGLDSGGNPRMVGVTPQGALQMADAGPQPEQVVYSYRQIMGLNTVVLNPSPVTGVMFRALGNGINVKLSYDGENYPVAGILMYDRRIVVVRGRVVSFQASSNAPFYGPYLEYWLTAPGPFVPR